MLVDEYLGPNASLDAIERALAAATRLAADVLCSRWLEVCALADVLEGRGDLGEDQLHGTLKGIKTRI